MPSILHETLIELFRQRPQMVAELLAELNLLPSPPPVSCELADSDLTQAQPVVRQADLVVRATGAHPFSTIVEVQLGVDAEKLWSWPLYIAAERATARTEVVLLVLTIDRPTARWADRPIVLGPGSVVRPVVFGPEHIPLVLEPRRAQEAPELAVLSAVAHAEAPGAVERARVAVEATLGLDEVRARLYIDTVLLALPMAARRALEQAMIPNWQPQSEFLRKLDAEAEARGWERGELALLTRQLQARFGPLPDHIRALLAEASSETRQRWAEELLFADSLEALFGSAARH